METQQANVTVPTILDVLNADCWRLVLNYLSVREIMRTERVSRGWQRVVLGHFAGISNYRIKHLYKDDDCYDFEPLYLIDNYCIIELHKCELFEDVVKKMGPFIVSLMARRIDQERLEAISLNCPNLESLAIRVKDESLNDVVTSGILEELTVSGSYFATGCFLANLRSSLKTLAINNVSGFQIQYLQSAMNHLTGLTRFELNGTRIELRDLHLLLNEMPNLEFLSLMRYSEGLDLGDSLAAVCRLRSLRVLYLDANGSVTDEWLCGAARGCPGLRIVNIGSCRTVTRNGVVELCRARPELTELSVLHLCLEDEDLEACVGVCGALELLDASWCNHLTQALPGRLARPRARPLRLRLYGTPVKKEQVRYDYEGLAILWNKTPMRYVCRP